MTIDTSVRRYVFSTAMLQEALIECCCGPKVQPTVPLQVESVDFLRLRSGKPASFYSLRSIDLASMPVSIKLPSKTQPIGIEVQFTGAAVNQSSVKDQKTFTVTKTIGPSPKTLAAQQLKWTGANTVQWLAEKSDFAANLDARVVYQLILSGSPPAAITTSNNSPLDGDGQPRKLPSGDGNAGGDFTLQFIFSLD